MDKFLALSFAGLCTAGIYAIAASGLVLTYTTTGVFNFAHGAIGMLGAFTYWQLKVDWGLPTPLAVAIVLLVIAPLFGAGVVLFRTRAGVTMRATVDDRPLVTLNGGQPDSSAMLAWAIGCSLAALAGILAAPDQGLSPVLALLIVNAYAAAVIGRLRSLPM